MGPYDFRTPQQRSTPKRWRDSTPLCPAGHLLRKGGDRMLRGFRQLSTSKKGAALKLPISPLAGEMSGRTEGGVKERGVTVPFLIVFIQGISA
ncbi:MAG: hypothetical protein E5W96_19755, partial [Mesorhizobium sp.]